MNPIFWLLIILVSICLWFCATFMFKSLGGFLGKILNETKIFEAEAAAKAKIIEAEGEAEANKIISRSLTEQLIKKMEMEARQQHGWVTVQGANTVVTE